MDRIDKDAGSGIKVDRATVYVVGVGDHDWSEVGCDKLSRWFAIAESRCTITEVVGVLRRYVLARRNTTVVVGIAFLVCGGEEDKEDARGLVFGRFSLVFFCHFRHF